MIVSILIFIIIFSVIVITHEGGHYLIARANGIHAVEFMVGMGPKLFAKEMAGTLFTIRLLPFGGACVFESYDGLEEQENTALGQELIPGGRNLAHAEEYTNGYRSASVWARIATTVAGPLFNVILGYLLALVVTSFSYWSFPVVSGVMEDSAAVEAGLQEGDTIVRMDGEKIHQSDQVILNSRFNEGEPIHLTVRRDGELKDITLTPRYDQSADRYYMGIYLGQYEKIEGAKVIPYAWYNVEYYATSVFKGLRLMIQGKLGNDGLAGPVGMVQAVDDTYEAVQPYGLSSVVLTMMDLTIILCINLAIMNMLPIPAVDGGKLIFLLIEAIRGKPVPPEKEGMVHLAGMAALLVLMIYVTYNDVVRFITH